MAYPAKAVEGGEQLCLPEEEQETEQSEIGQEIRNLIRNTVLCLQGQSENYPATSCLEIFTCNPESPSGYYWITNISDSETVIQVYCDMNMQCGCSNVTGGWTRVAYLNMSDPTHNCPIGWNLITRSTDPKRTCGRTNETLTNGGGCSSVGFSTYGIFYNHICGRVVGYQKGLTGAFSFEIFAPSH